jgi:hypothetical protein
LRLGKRLASIPCQVVRYECKRPRRVDIEWHEQLSSFSREKHLQFF